jgi:alpha-beta hydrolase superfamily lysophospholipase
VSWQPDVLDGFEQRTLTLPDAIDGPVEVVLVRKRSASASNAGVRYTHGFVDYFFQEHLAAFYNERGLHFYAVDLRRHGRSLRSHQRPNDTRDLDEFLAESALRST